MIRGVQHKSDPECPCVGHVCKDGLLQQAGHAFVGQAEPQPAGRCLLEIQNITNQTLELRTPMTSILASMISVESALKTLKRLPIPRHFPVTREFDRQSTVASGLRPPPSVPTEPRCAPQVRRHNCRALARYWQRKAAGVEGTNRQRLTKAMGTRAFELVGRRVDTRKGTADWKGNKRTGKRFRRHLKAPDRAAAETTARSAGRTQAG